MSLLPYKITALARTDAVGLNIIPFASVSILTSGGSFATLREADLTTPIANPFNCDSNGEREVWIAGGEYSVSVEGGQSWDIKLSGASDIQSVATIADLEAITGLTEGQVIYVNEYETGFKDGGGEFVVDSTATEGQIITTSDGAKCVRRSDIYKAESWGAHSSRTDNSSYFQAAADAVGRIEGKRGVIYKFTGQVSLTNSFEFLANKCQVEFGDGHLNLFNLLADVDYVKISGVSNTIIKGVLPGEGCYKNFYSSYENTGTVIGFPVGTAYIAKQTVIEDCVIHEARIFSAGDAAEETSLDCINLKAKNTDYLVRPCSILSSGHDSTTLDKLRLSANIYEDIIKCSPGNNFTLCNSVLKQKTEDGLFPIAQIDIYQGVEGAEIYGNRFYNVGTHRKQSGALGETIDEARDSVHDNRFYVEGLAGRSDTVYPVYWRGAFGNFHDNQFYMRLDPTYTGTVSGMLADTEVDIVEPFDQTAPTALKIHDNTFDFIGCGGTNQYAINLGAGTIVDLQRDVLGNTVYGATRFLNGLATVFAGNSWHLPAVGAAQINAQIAYGNDIPDALITVGKFDNALRQFVVPVAGVIDATYANFCRISDGVTITSVTGGRQGQQMQIYARNGVTITHGTPIRLKGAVNAVMPGRSFLTLTKVPDSDGQWEESSRSF